MRRVRPGLGVGAVVAYGAGVTASRALSLVARRKAHMEAHPLAYARLWHAEGWDTSGPTPRARTSQRVAAQAFVNADAVAALGGNGTGKSVLMGMLAVACMLGRDHPDVKAWCALNSIDPLTIPPYAGRVLASALTSDDSRRVVRTKVKAYLPRDGSVTWRNENGDGVAEVKIDGLRTPDNPNGATIVFKSNDQGQRAYQGDEFDVVLFDEEHDREVVEEAMMRLGRRPWREGWAGHFMTPLKGLTWIYDDFVDKPKDGHKAVWMHGPDNPHADQDFRRRQLSRMSEAMQRARNLGEFVSGAGRVYAMFSRQAHVIPARHLPRDWPRFRSIDFGTANPFCCLWFAVDPADRVFHVYRCLYRAGLSTEENGQEVARLSEGERFEFDVADPESLDGRRTLAIKCDIIAHSANKAVSEGISDVISVLQPDADGKPHLLFHDTDDMRPVLREIEGYRYPDATGRRDPNEHPLKKNDHAMDALRYGVRFYLMTEG